MQLTLGHFRNVLLFWNPLKARLAELGMPTTEGRLPVVKVLYSTHMLGV